MDVKTAYVMLALRPCGTDTGSPEMLYGNASRLNVFDEKLYTLE